MLAHLGKLLRRSGDKVLISAETLTAVAMHPQTLPGLVQVIRETHPDIRAICYLREPLAYMTSLMSQRIYGLAAGTGDDRFTKDRLYPGFRKRIEPWFDTLGEDRVTVRLYDRSALFEQDVVADLARWIGVETPDFDRLNNESLAAESFAVLYRFGIACAEGRVDLSLQDRRKVVQALRGFGSSKFSVIPADLHQLVDENRADIEWAEARMGQPFPTPQPSTGRMVFDTEADVFDYAEAVRPDLLAYLGEKAPAMLRRTISELYSS
ncbi:hypothetical protein EU803_11545 [Loktanella sp. IMCC34160]|uniref:hypothetical protein n=1 Tax=Loktanella sp. IMCC34160 TaxID=2510646 RepID=UPI00101C73BF|nr:hypothetical protein [Loktanella sp. IMCC34160]RYG90631.1 hypothetical protein EU803_11545 [Loktanella sp. IMCC34160]